MSSVPAPNWDNDVIANLLTRQRLRSYLNATDQDLAAALRLYEWNTAASAAVLALIATTEVVVRNSLDKSLQEWSSATHSTTSWFAHVPLDRRGRDDLNLARSRAARRHPVEIHGKVIAELSFGFWRYLTATRYLTSLWIPVLHKAFPLGSRDVGRRRREVEQCLSQLAFVRNRAAHHEPIHQRDLRRDTAMAKKLVGWVSPDAAQWLTAKEPVSAVFAAKPQAT